jgi:hypothetical protein
LDIVRSWEENGHLYAPCGSDTCPGVMMPYGNDVLCSEAITALIRDNDEGGGG